MTKRIPKRGEVYYISQFPTVGHEQFSGRPAVIVSNDSLNEMGNVFEACFFTLQSKKPLPTHTEVLSGKCYGSTVLCEQVTSVDFSRIGDFIEILPEEVMKEIDKCLLCSLGLIDYVKPTPTPVPVVEDNDRVISELRSELRVRTEMYNELLNKFISR